MGDCKLSRDALIDQKDESEIKVGKLECHKLTIYAQDGKVDILGGGAVDGSAAVQAKKHGGSIKIIGDFQKLTTHVDGAGSIERK